MGHPALCPGFAACGADPRAISHPDGFCQSRNLRVQLFFKELSNLGPGFVQIAEWMKMTLYQHMGGMHPGSLWEFFEQRFFDGHIARISGGGSRQNAHLQINHISSIDVRARSQRELSFTTSGLPFIPLFFC